MWPPQVASCFRGPGRGPFLAEPEILSDVPLVAASSPRVTGASPHTGPICPALPRLPMKTSAPYAEATLLQITEGDAPDNVGATQAVSLSYGWAMPVLGVIGHFALEGVHGDAPLSAATSSRAPGVSPPYRAPQPDQTSADEEDLSPQRGGLSTA